MNFIQMNNFPFKAYNRDTNQVETFWYSRSIAVCITVYITNSKGELCVLANKRGPGCPDYVGYWVCPCGYLDFDETTKEAAARECFEETGIEVPLDKIKFVGYEDSVDANLQNVTFRFSAKLNELPPSPTNKYNVGKETEDIKWIPVKNVNKYKWAFGHKQLIINNQ